MRPPTIDKWSFIVYYIPIGMKTGISRNKASKPPVGVYIATTVCVFFLTLSAADSVGFVPCDIDGTCESVALADLPELGDTDTTAVPAATTTAPRFEGVLPKHIAIPAVNIDLPIQNPSTKNVDALDALLVNGPARYVESAKLGVDGNVLIFAHSSHLPIVHNKMFQAFNNIPNLKSGDLITVTGADGVDYLYSVTSVEKADTNDGTKIDLAVGGKKLTLVTCDTLTGKSARYILTADYVGTSGK